MTDKILKSIRVILNAGNYALRPHAVKHMLEEGFHEKDIIEAILNGKILELYIEEDRCLINGTYHISDNNRESLHVIVDFWSESAKIDWIDIVTAYIPRQPFWETPRVRGKRKK